MLLLSQTAKMQMFCGDSILMLDVASFGHLSLNARQGAACKTTQHLCPLQNQIR